MTTIKEIAARLSLSQATVSRALRNDASLSIAPETRARILTAAMEMGYIRKRSGPKKRQAQRRILVVHKYQTFRNQIDSSYYFTIRTGIEDVCAQRDALCTFVAIEELGGKKFDVDGVVVIGNYTQVQYDMLLDFFKSEPISAVGIVAYHPERVDHVSFSNHASASLALNHLFSKGHTKIGYLGIEEAAGTELFGSRKGAFLSVMEKFGETRPEWIWESDHGTDRVEQGYRMMTRLLAQESLPTALFCANDPIALGAINALLERDLRVPEHISIVAHDGSYPSQYSFPPLTTVDVHPYQLGAEGAEMTFSRIERTSKYAKTLLLYPALIERDSVRDIS